VSDGSLTASLPAFSIVVSTTTTTGSATLSWTPPTLNTDGTALTNLAGYRILYGHDPEDLDHSVYIPDPAAHSFEFATLDAGTWYFSIVAVNAGGLEGPATAPARKII